MKRHIYIYIYGHTLNERSLELPQRPLFVTFEGRCASWCLFSEALASGFQLSLNSLNGTCLIALDNPYRGRNIAAPCLSLLRPFFACAIRLSGGGP